MAITRISQSSIKEGLEKYNSFYAGLSGLLFGNYESIQTITVGSGGASSIEFTSIPGTYQHLQVRMIARVQESGTGVNNGMSLRLNSDTGSNYAYHELRGSGSSATSSGAASQSVMDVQTAALGDLTSGIFGTTIIDILDYSTTAKYTTVRTLAGVDGNGTVDGYGGIVSLLSGLWMNTSAVSSTTIFPAGSRTFAQHTTAALYGVKA